MNTRIIFIGTVVLIIVLFVIWLFARPTQTPIDLSQEGAQDSVAQQEQASNTNAMEEDTITELNVETTQEGSGPAAEAGDTLRVHYEGRLTNGTVFDSSYNRGEPIEFEVGTGQVIPGWDQGLLGVRAGQKLRLEIPADMAYGNRAVGPIPANSALIFDVEVVDVIK